MATMTELRAHSAAIGTARKQKLKKTLKTGATIVATVAIVLLVTVWTTSLINSNLEEASSPPRQNTTAYSNPEVLRAATAREVTSDKCQSQMQTLSAGRRSITLNDASECYLGFDIQEGEFLLYGNNGYGIPYSEPRRLRAGPPPPDDKQFFVKRIVMVSAAGSMTLIECPKNTRMRNYRCWDR